VCQAHLLLRDTREAFGAFFTTQVKQVTLLLYVWCQAHLLLRDTREALGAPAARRSLSVYVRRLHLEVFCFIFCCSFFFHFVYSERQLLVDPS
jgi:hypothetical protein